MGLENNLSLSHNREFYMASTAYLLAGLADGLLTARGLNIGNASDWNPLVHSLINHYGITDGIAITKLNGLLAVMAGEIVERRSTSQKQKSLTHYLLCAGVLLSGIGVIGWTNGF